MSKTRSKIPKARGVDSVSSPGFCRYLAAVLYDFLLLLAVLFLATALILPINAGEAYTSHQILYPIYLLGVSFAFYGWFWTHGGQTLGLRAWKLKLQTFDQQPISWTQAGLRFSIALLSWLAFGCGFLWILVDKHHRSWHDHVSKTALFLQATDKKP